MLTLGGGGAKKGMEFGRSQVLGAKRWAQGEGVMRGGRREEGPNNKQGRRGVFFVGVTEGVKRLGIGTALTMKLSPQNSFTKTDT